jgi:hypothetical protein
MWIMSSPCLFSSFSRLSYWFHSFSFQSLRWSPLSTRFMWYPWFLLLIIERHLFVIYDFWYVVHVLWFLFLISCFPSSPLTNFDRSFHSLPHRRSNLLIRFYLGSFSRYGIACLLPTYRNSDSSPLPSPTFIPASVPTVGVLFYQSLLWLIHIVVSW